ncbi:hypothetical protein SLEP1_g47116 [Rubroshorea leprosula]|uniref:Peptidase S9 prolyl oligopeptidase catalytic domain-containing protein n=1 Tax=Rubroshorea leprosula TaxID=152421 RepID=A0AAV5LPK2_9ROSI|nr:hypothetical protein SLEP1_g47116 [Rubroshorea leprosula]
MEGEESLQRFSPEVMVQDPNIKNAVSLLPPIFLFHGTADYSIPSDASKCFAETLRRLGVKSEVMLYEGRTHTDLFLQVINEPHRTNSIFLSQDSFYRKAMPNMLFAWKTRYYYLGSHERWQRRDV